METLDPVELDSLYRELEPHLELAPASVAHWLRAEVALHLTHGASTGVSYALVTGRRKEAGERPPVVRDRG